MGLRGEEEEKGEGGHSLHSVDELRWCILEWDGGKVSSQEPEWPPWPRHDDGAEDDDDDDEDDDEADDEADGYYSRATASC